MAALKLVPIGDEITTGKRKHIFWTSRIKLSILQYIVFLVNDFLCLWKNCFLKVFVNDIIIPNGTYMRLVQIRQNYAEFSITCSIIRS